ncbi:MAG TPA: SGNH/GDSL hydrolase family protein [Usitatibacter sp.]|nr:SGNH/GDSL hydrolase family protein [Usitatibacter sp.]
MRGVANAGVARIPPRNSMAVLGDSFTQRNMATLAASVYSVPTYAIIILTNMLLGGAFDIVNIDGQSGTTSASFLSRLSASVLAFRPRYAYIQGTVNDILSGAPLTLQQSIANYTAMFQQCNAAGITVITNTVPPFTALNTAAKRTQWLRFNAWLLNVAQRQNGIIVLRNDYQYLDPAVATCQPNAAFIAIDVTHPGVRDSFTLAQSNAAALRALGIASTPAPPFLCGLGVTGAEDDSLHPNPHSFGTAGVKSSGNVTGTVATTMSVGTTGNLGTAVCSKVPRTDGPGEWQQIVFTPSAANQICTYQNFGAAIALGNAQVGDIVSLYSEFEIDGSTPAANFRWVGAQITYIGGAYNTAVFPVNSGFENLGGLTGANLRGVVKTPPIAIPSGTTGMFFGAVLHGAGAGLATTVRFGQSAFRNFSRETL